MRSSKLLCKMEQISLLDSSPFNMTCSKSPSTLQLDIHLMRLYPINPNLPCNPLENVLAFPLATSTERPPAMPLSHTGISPPVASMLTVMVKWTLEIAPLSTSLLRSGLLLSLSSAWQRLVLFGNRPTLGRKERVGQSTNC
ncbi:hypothetical protein M413DRAFT_357255 [Hebeloma cylindrosporum]|uniref:Uncharacterized protein n=1 Tax=Hebeloma cylindrosporum TaxID=76867 RepID=A0A0C3CKH1_HEBCY|nr:hypothetical protein M413DRAFT_357255 [Hebeloma cylindrosporum h7]